MVKKWGISLLVLVITLFIIIPASAEAPTEFDPSVCAYAGEPVTDACLEMIETFPEPQYEQILPDGFTIGSYSFWRVGPEATPLFSAPNGGVIGDIPAGFNFVNAIDTSVEGWLQIEGGEWIQRGTARYVEPSYFRGVRITDGLKQNFAWVLDTTGIYTSEYPGGPSSAATNRVPLRYEMINIFAEAVDSEGWTWYLIGPNQWIKQVYVSVIKPVEKPEGVAGRWVAVDLFEQTLVAYEDETPVFGTLISSGLPQWETDQGIYTIWAKLDRDAMSGATGAPDAYALQSVPWTMYFDGSVSLHGTYWHNLFGYRRSHGCVNLSISDARHIFQWTSQADPDEDGNIVNYVYVHSSGDYRGE